MTPVEWTPEDFVFSRQMDADHRKLFEELEIVRRAAEVEKAPGQLRYSVWRLSKDLSVHCASEERLMREWHYPARSWHQRQHEAGRKKIARLLEAARQPDPARRDAAFQVFATWIKDHVHLADRMFAAYMRNEERGRLAS
jgi:hemerythrin-like metal-binding protein